MQLLTANSPYEIKGSGRILFGKVLCVGKTYIKNNRFSMYDIDIMRDIACLFC